LAASLAAEAHRAEAVAVLLSAMPSRLRARRRSAEVTWLLETMAGADAIDVPDDATCARLLRDVADRELWAAALLEQSRERARAQRALWTAVLRGAPEGWVAGPALLLGFAAWLDGHGALAWCAVDRCVAEAPDDARAVALGELLLNAVSPARWAAMVRHGVRAPA
jgi:hypothetical protein